MDDMMTADAAAFALGVTIQTVHVWVGTGKIGGSVFVRTRGRLVPRAEVDRLLAEREAARSREVARWAPSAEGGGGQA